MANPLYEMFGKPQMNGPLGIIQQFNQFRQNFHGDAQQQIQAMLNSGKITQAQVNQAMQLANQLKGFIK